MPEETLEEIVRQVQEMGRVEVVEALHQLALAFPLDFSQDFLAQCTEERLKHILLAARLHTGRNAKSEAPLSKQTQSPGA
jgi:hypothetical protein